MRRDLPGVAGYAAICAMLAVLLTVSTAEPARAHPPTGTPTAAAGAFLAGLAADRRSEAARPFDDPERFAFTRLPGRRGGL